MKNKIKLGFVPLTDSAPLIAAQQLGYFSELGLQVELMPQNSWSTLRDKLQTGLLDAAQLLAPMPIASTLGLDGAKVAMKVPLILSQNGNAITLSNQLITEVLECNELDKIPFPMPAELLSSVIKARAEAGKDRLRFASVFPYSCHQYQLNDWLNKANLKAEVDIITLPPSAMSESLSSNLIDGFCVGGPWNAKSVRELNGQTILTSSHIWLNKTEKVLAITRDYAEQNHSQAVSLVAALKRACLWLEPQINRFEAANWLQKSNILNEPLEVIAPSLLGSCITREGLNPEYVVNYNRFIGSEEEAMNRPIDRSEQWLVSKMIEAEQIPEHLHEQALAGLGVFDNTLFDEAELTEGAHDKV
jgi:NitT/TauT family transport system ATP-binding protein/nitrate/nitrite transport system substrate-binding protein